MIIIIIMVMSKLWSCDIFCENLLLLYCDIAVFSDRCIYCIFLIFMN